MKTSSSLSIPVLVLIQSLILTNGKTSAQPLVVTINITQNACNNDGAAFASVTGGTPPYRYYWNGPGFTSTLQSVSNLPAGYYFLYVVDTLNSHGYVDTTLGVVQVDSFVNTPEHCNHADGSTAVFISGGTAPYDYWWSNGGVHSNSSALSDTIKNLTQGQYTVTVTDAAGCVVASFPDSNQSNQGYVNRVSPVTTTVTTTPCNCNDGTATVVAANGTPPYTYLWNTVPPQYTQTAAGLDVTYYAVTVTDASGCEGNDYGRIDPGPNYIQSTANVSYALCPAATGSITLNVSGGTPPYTYLWSTGQTTAAIASLPPGNYTCQISDAAGCTVTRTKTVLQQSPIYLNINAGNASCGMADGVVSITPQNGTPPYTYSWSNGQTTSSTLFPAGLHNVIVTDANNCPASVYFRVDENPNCYAVLQGTVWHDINGNCSRDPGEFGLPYPPVQVTPYHVQNYWTSGSASPSYSENVVADTYTITQTAPASWTQVCPSGTVSVTAVAGNSYTNDFYDQPDSIFDDLTTYIYCHGSIVRGITTRFTVDYRNSGTTVMNGTLVVYLDSNMILINSYPLYSSFDAVNNIAYYSILNLLPRIYDNIHIDVMVPNSVALGDTVRMVSVLQPVSTDKHPNDNTDTCTSIVAGSYDPNEKQVVPAGEGAQGSISTGDSVLRYTVHFQNTGNYVALRVKVVDTLDSHLDPATVVPVNHEPNFDLSVDRNGQVVTFEYKYIYLSAELQNEPGSRGFVSFTVKQKAGLTVGTVIKNRAAIYFDLNEPVLTNEVMNTIHSVTAVQEAAPSWSFSMAPNPAGNLFELRFSLAGKAETRLSIYDVVGRRVAENNLGGLDAGNHTLSLSVQKLSLAPGIYFIELRQGGEGVARKLVVSE